MGLLLYLKMREQRKKLADLPESNDDFWDGEKIRSVPQSIDICVTHSRDNYMDHKGYVNRHDGTVGCIYCPWGALLPGHLRVENGRLINIDEIVN